MTRGKHAAQAANRRLELAEERVAELTAKMEQERRDWSGERRELAEQVTRLRSDIARQARALAKDEVERVLAEASEDRGTLAKKYEQAALDALKLLYDNRRDPPSEMLMIQVAESLGVQYSDVAAHRNDGNRLLRRIRSNKASRGVAAMGDQMDGQRRPAELDLQEPR